MLEKIRAIKEEILRFSQEKRLFIFCAMIASFLINAEYAIIRPVSNALFITAYGTEALPYVWLAAVPLNFFIVSLYNRFLPRFGCKKMFIFTTSLVCAVNLGCLFLFKLFPSLSFFFYIWKEIYILLMFQQLWSVIHSTIKLDHAKYLYGILFAVGSLGAIFGSFLSGFQAVSWGSENLILSTLPLYAILTVSYIYLLKHGESFAKHDEGMQRGSLKEGVRLITSSRLLTFIVLIVVLMQVCSALIYYQFNTFLEAAVTDKDMRTEFFGRISGFANFVTILLQFFGPLLFVHFLGLRQSHLFIPALLACNAGAFLLLPVFPLITLSYVTIKAFDFSVFTILKEMLYIPLSKEEKFQAKAVIDVFAYRAAKAGASFLILGFQWISAPFSVLSWTLLALFFSWVLVVWRLFERPEEVVN